MSERTVKNILCQSSRFTNHNVGTNQYIKEKRKIVECARNSGLNVSDFIRQRVCYDAPDLMQQITNNYAQSLQTKGLERADFSRKVEGKTCAAPRNPLRLLVVCATINREVPLIKPFIRINSQLILKIRLDLVSPALQESCETLKIPFSRCREKSDRRKAAFLLRQIRYLLNVNVVTPVALVTPSGVAHCSGDNVVSVTVRVTMSPANSPEVTVPTDVKIISPSATTI